MKLARALSSLAHALTAQGASFAVVGGLAASARGEPRFTRDVDIVVAVADDEAAESVIYSLQVKGYAVLATVEQQATNRLATVRLRNADGVVCDLIFATTGIEVEIARSAEKLTLFAGLDVPTATIEALLAMKILSAAPARPRDTQDIQNIVRHNPSFDEAELTRLLSLIVERGYARGEDLTAKWACLRDTLGI